jgi:antitoxin (DNA-binding transcriptional repressor) of toxin-antitoxin stability system
MYNRLMASMTVSQARAALPELLTRVEEGDQITITRHGRDVAVLVRPDVIRTRPQLIIEVADRIHTLVAEAAPAALPDGVGLTAERADELVRQIRAGREGR